MHRTTIYLPDDLRRAIRQAVKESGGTAADFVRRAVERAVSESRSPAPRLPLFSSGDSRLADRVDDALRGFGER